HTKRCEWNWPRSSRGTQSRWATGFRVCFTNPEQGCEAMSCSRMETKILAYVDGRLKESERLDVEKHLATCAACKLRAAEFRAVHSLLDELPQIEPSEAFDLRVHALIAAEPVKQSWWSWLSVSPRAAFAAAMLVLATVWIGLRPGEPQHPAI